MSNIPKAYGGQAVIEGVMFGGQRYSVTAVRRKDNTIEYFHEQKQEHPWVKNIKRIPFIRGIVGLINSSATGARHLNFSSEQVSADADNSNETDQKSSKLTMILGVAVVGVLSFLFGKLIFTVVPAILADVLFKHWVSNNILQNLIEGGIKIILLFGYIFAIAKTPMIKRLFQYHGAEHKVINAYEAGVELTVKNVQRFSTLHYRCGSSFLVFSVLIGVLIYSFFHYDTLWERIYQRVLLLPVVIGVSYETLQATNKVRDIPVLRYLGYPGLWLQKLTTREPDDKQVEVAIASFIRMRELDEGKTDCMMSIS
ncbi:DUF1385 domain-containing protein [Aneurinibacillus sp. Ricciae_BoGa-3]|uniref:DUF1385 domain-containing protein n=1 Tax=Aneurinibacillus sp. Ricciae_BoGa-3 TaxID=3022697 RepID=UPI002340AEB5|nr:DUF1385 domain-containing protein [Aneurinibacillus sp. Ricciae_BoGa-3]WCK53159.1 DUF1385 domain-containing protein [Aneurinibacillus sp. Ricciae_BoGa-3]